ncbi:MAG: DUF5069 domain-containing protein [Candidatus Eremiobacteraeota bacterium]|nr:DUF5069 domain-containing protein [Candidatus Eremiobacteraeota bacterium]
MEPLDLTKMPPRSPREKIAGYVLLARTIDKLRAQLPGGKLGAYHVEGASNLLLGTLGVSEEQLQAAVAAATSDGDVAAWVRTHAKTAGADDFNQMILTKTLASLDPENAAHFRAQLEPSIRNEELGLLVDAIDRDDRVCFGVSQPI